MNISEILRELLINESLSGPLQSINIDKLREALAELNHKDCIDSCTLQDTNSYNIVTLIVPEKYQLYINDLGEVEASLINDLGEVIEKPRVIASLEELK